MSFHLYLLLKLVHIVAMAGWLAAGVSAPGDIRRTLLLGRPHVDALIPRIQRSARLTIGSAVLTLLSGLGLVSAQGGFATVPVRIHIGLGLTLATFVVGAALAEPTWRRIMMIIEGHGDLKEALALSRRFTICFGVEHLLRFAVLVLMVFKF